MHFGGNDIQNSTHAEEYAAAIGAPHHRNPMAVGRFDDCVRGWVAGKGKGYPHGVIHIAPPIRTESDVQTFDTAMRAFQHFVRIGAGPVTLLRGFVVGSAAAWEQPLGAAVPELFSKAGRVIREAADDTAYLAAVKAGDMETCQRMVDACAKAAGYDRKAYHGTPVAGFNVFAERPTYFADEREMRRVGLDAKAAADVFQSSSASSIRSWRLPANGTPKTLSVYLRTSRIFDTRKPSHRRIFNEQFQGQGGEDWSSNGTPLTSRNLPDWSDGRDLVDWIKETNQPYDALILDEGSLPQLGGGVKWRGPSVVVWNPSQIKSADPVTYDDAGNVIPLSRRFGPSNDIREAVDCVPTTCSYGMKSELEAILSGQPARSVLEAGKPHTKRTGLRSSLSEYGRIIRPREAGVPGILRCDCGEELFMYSPGADVECEKCGADYNSAGQRLADRSQWGEETGETAADYDAGFNNPDRAFDGDY